MAVSGLALVSSERINLRGGASGRAVPSSGRLGHTKLETMFPLEKKKGRHVVVVVSRPSALQSPSLFR